MRVECERAKRMLVARAHECATAVLAVLLGELRLDVSRLTDAFSEVSSCAVVPFRFGGESSCAFVFLLLGAGKLQQHPVIPRAWLSSGSSVTAAPTHSCTGH